MKFFLLALIISSFAFADTPPPNAVKLKGADGTLIGNVSDSLKVTGSTSIVSGSISVNNFPVTQPVSGNLGRTWTLSGATDVVQISGTVPVSFATGGTQQVSGTVLVGNFPSVQQVSGTVNVTPHSVTVSSGSIGVANFPASQVVTGSLGRTWTLGGATDVVQISGTVPVSFAAGGVQQVSGTVLVGNFPGVQQVSGTVNVTPHSVTVSSGSIGVANFPAVQQVSGTVITAAANPPGRSLIFKVRNNYAVNSTSASTTSYTTLVTSTSAITNQMYIFDSSGQTLNLSYAASCGSLSSATNTIFIVPGGNDIQNWQVPASQCLGVQATSAAVSTGELDINAFN